MNMDEQHEPCASHKGRFDWFPMNGRKSDLLNIIMLGLAKNLPEHDETYELHRLLGALLSKELTIDEN